MGQEMQTAAWRKAIPAARDRLQSRVLVWVVTALLFGLLAAQVGLLRSRETQPFAAACGFSTGFAVLVWRMRAATWAAAILGGAVCMNILLVPQMALGWRHTALPALLTLFVLTFAATRFGRRRKEALGVAEVRRGRRAAQIAANLGIAGLCSAGISAAWFAACIAALAEATADTVSSETGQALGGATWMITTGRRVSSGADGGVSVLGSMFGVASAAAIAAVAALSGSISIQAAVLVFGAGVAGLLFDSVLGATLERRGWLGNDWVNFASTAFAALLAYMLTRHTGGMAR